MADDLDVIYLKPTPRFRNFDWEKTKTFYYVAKFNGLASAARFLNISQSALSRQITYLEQHLGCPLFVRHSGGVTLTRKGEELFKIVETTFIGLKGFTQNTYADVTNGKKRKIRIATTHALASYVLCDLILNYNESHPALTFELMGEDHYIDIVLNDVDIAIRPFDERTQAVEQTPIFTLEKRLYASTEYLEKYGEPQTIEDLKHHHLIAFGRPESHPYADVNWILKLGMPRNQLHEPVFTSNSVECMVKAARSGIGIVSSYPEMTLIKTSGLRNILPQVRDKKITFYFICPEYLKKDTEILGLKEFLKEHLSQ